MDRREQMIAELRRRSEVLPGQLAAWKRLTEENTDGMGIHGRQFRAVELLFDEHLKYQRSLLQELVNAPDDTEFSALRTELEGEISGACGVMAIFRNILAQRLQTERDRAVLDAADLIAADCYRPVISKAQGWRVLGKHQYREPPLTFFNASRSPSALKRGTALALLGFELEVSEGEMELPIPVMSLRFHDAVALWSLCSIYHETGHLLDQDLRLADEIGDLLTRALEGKADELRLGLWFKWRREMLADAFGVLLGGAGFALALMDMLYQPASQVVQIEPGKLHPASYVRVFLLGALLRTTSVPGLDKVASKIEGAWRAVYGPPPDDLKEILAECDTVAEVLLDAHLWNRLRNHRLLELITDPQGDYEKAEELALHLRCGAQAPRVRGFPIRLVPSAAYIATDGVRDDYDLALESIQGRSLDFLASIPRPSWMADPGRIEPEREEYLRMLASKLRFSGSIKTRKERYDD